LGLCFDFGLGLLIDSSFSVGHKTVKNWSIPDQAGIQSKLEQGLEKLAKSIAAFDSLKRGQGGLKS
jgi:hypothetical protein